MRVLVAGDCGYVDTANVRSLQRADHEVALEAIWYDGCDYWLPSDYERRTEDIRDGHAAELVGFDAPVKNRDRAVQHGRDPNAPAVSTYMFSSYSLFDAASAKAPRAEFDPDVASTETLAPPANSLRRQVESLSFRELTIAGAASATCRFKAQLAGCYFIAYKMPNCRTAWLGHAYS